MDLKKKKDRIIDEARRDINSTDRRTNLENLEQFFWGLGQSRIK